MIVRCLLPGQGNIEGYVNWVFFFQSEALVERFNLLFFSSQHAHVSLISRSVPTNTKTKTQAGNRRRPRPSARPLVPPVGPHFHRAAQCLRARLHPPHRSLARHPGSARLPQHPTAQIPPARRDGAGGRRGGSGDAAISASEEGPGVSCYYDGDAVGGVGSVF